MTAGSTALITHPACLHHEPLPGHPERPARLQAVWEALEGEAFRALRREPAPRAKIAALARVHDRAYIKALFAAVPSSGYALLDLDTSVSPGSRDAALRAAGAVIRAVDLVLTEEAKNAFCAVRPPGHHAGPSRAMGFCLFNNVAVGAAHARAVHGVKRLAILDFDVHHGNGTQAAFESETDVFYGSTHQFPLFPGTGLEDDGVHIFNKVLEPGEGGPAFRRAYGELLRSVRRFEPELIFLSAGFDAHKDEPMAQIGLDEADFAWATRETCAVADKTCRGRVVSVLEGGYDLPALARCVQAHVQALMAA